MSNTSVSIPRESVEDHPVVVTVDNAQVLTNVQVQHTINGERPAENNWVAAVVSNQETHIHLDGTWTVGPHTIWARLYENATPGVEVNCGVIHIT